MSNLTEFAITSDASGQLWNSCIWDPKAGTALMIYKGGGASGPRTLSFLGNDYLMSAESVKPLLHVWPLNSQEMIHQSFRTVCPGRVTALAASPDATYCVAGIEEKLHVWQIASGRLMAVASRHFQKITCIRFTDDGSHFASGGEDGMVMVWSLANLLSLATGDAGDPRYIFSDHSLPVQDLCIGHGGLRARLVSVSNDRTCKAYDLASGTLLLSVIFNSSLTAVTTDTTEYNVFVGTIGGDILQFDLRQPPRMREYHIESMDDKSLTFSGHTKAVTCLSTSQDGLTLLSGSNDEKVMVWHISSRQCIRVLPHKGPVTNAFFVIAPKQVFSSELNPTVLLHSFQRGIDHDETNNTVNVITSVDLYPNAEVPPTIMGSENLRPTSVDKGGAVLKQERDMYQQINHDLYKFAIEELLSPISNGHSNVKDTYGPNHVENVDAKTFIRAPLDSKMKIRKKKEEQRKEDVETGTFVRASLEGKTRRRKKKGKQRKEDVETGTFVRAPLDGEMKKRKKKEKQIIEDVEADTSVRSTLDVEMKMKKKKGKQREEDVETDTFVRAPLDVEMEVTKKQGKEGKKKKNKKQRDLNFQGKQ